MNTQHKRFGTKQVIAAGALLLAASLLYGGLTMHDSVLFSSAGITGIHTALRAVIVVALIVVLFSRPPRSLQVRVMLGALSSVVLIGSFISMADYSIGIIDAVLYLQVSILLAMEAIESKPAPVQFSRQPSTN